MVPLEDLRKKSDTCTYVCRIPFNGDISKCQLNADDFYGTLKYQEWHHYPRPSKVLNIVTSFMKNPAAIKTMHIPPQKKKRPVIQNPLYVYM